MNPVEETEQSRAMTDEDWKELLAHLGSKIQEALGKSTEEMAYAGTPCCGGNGGSGCECDIG